MGGLSLFTAEDGMILQKSAFVVQVHMHNSR